MDSHSADQTRGTNESEPKIASSCCRQSNRTANRLKRPANTMTLISSIIKIVYLLAFTQTNNPTNSKVDCLHINSVEVPAAAMNSTQVTLVCNYELLADDQLMSVKWYKNYVEFFRFQPNGEFQATPPSNSTLEGDNQMANSRHQKREFELEGINLDMGKSNATHVHLKQTNLMSEGTYKCEVSADSPSFTTITSERQMKIYVLPKQKLSIVDHSTTQLPTLAPANGNGDGNSPQTQPHKAVAGSAGGSQFAYNLNDLINLTCVSGASRPAAKLTWLLNDVPIASSSKWLRLQQLTYGNRPSEQLIESRLTIAFRMHPNHLTGFNSPSSSRGLPRSNPVNSLKLSCHSKLSVEFSSESSILVSGGKTIIKKRQRQTSTASQLPSPSSLQFTSTSSSFTSRISDDSPAYRWPQSPSLQSLGRYRNNRHEASESVAAESQNGDSPLEVTSWPQHVRMPGANPKGSYIVVWTRRQLQDQAEHISDMLRQRMPNELEAPVIEAHAKIPEESGDEMVEGDLVAEDQADDGDSTGSVDSFDSSATTASSLDKDQATREQDYELNDAIEFTCRSRLAGSRAGDTGSPIRLEWLINNREIYTNKINSFNGTTFSYLEPLSSMVSTPRPSRRPSNSVETTTTKSMSLNQEDFANSATDQRNGNQVQRNSTLLVELSPSLFQLKELNLKCKTVIEQPLIEYESHVSLPIVSNGQTQQPSQFIVANQAPSSSQELDRRHYKSPWNQRPGNNRLSGSNPNYQGGNNGRQRSKNNSASRQSAASSFSSSLKSDAIRPLVTIFCSLLTVLML